MKIETTPIDGVLVAQQEPIGDARGYFARSFCETAFREAGVDIHIVQTNVSHNVKKGTLRGLHYQIEPQPEPKVVSCIRGEMFDVAVDLRPSSPTFKQWFGVELTAENAKALYIPPGCAHGFITLQDDTLVNYLMGEYFNAELGRGARWNDPAFAIEWPLQPTVISDRDAGYPDFE